MTKGLVVRYSPRSSHINGAAALTLKTAEKHHVYYSCASSSTLLQLHTDMDHGMNAVKYTLSGEGAGSIFTIDQITGDMHALVGLDRSVLISNKDSAVTLPKGSCRAFNRGSYVVLQ